jgi:hypothetical protein
MKIRMLNISTFARRALISAAAGAMISPFLFRHPVQAAADTFRAKATLQLCADYPFGGVSVEVKYRLADQTEYQPVTIESQSIDSGNNTGTFEFSLPSTLGTKPLYVAAFCKNSSGESRASNEQALSNCNALALLDSDADGIPDDQEDTDCGNFFSPGDASNPQNVDTDGDGVRDLVERVSGTDPTNPGSSPRPYIFASAPIDPNGDGESNPVVWRPSTGTWYIKDFYAPGSHLAVQFGLPGDVPFTYQPKSATTTDIGVVRRLGTDYLWLFHGPGFSRSNAANVTNLRFGIFGDNILPGPWEEAGVTSPAVARLFNDSWTFDIYLQDGSIREVAWGGNGDVPKVQDYDGDGLFDIAVFRPSNHTSYVIQSSDGQVKTYVFGSGTAEFTVRGDYTGDGIDDISFWEPLTGMFTTLTSDHGFNDTLGNMHNPNYYKESQLGLYYVHLPLSWNRHGGKLLYTVVDHNSGERFYRLNNDNNNPIIREQWGLPGDSQG